MSIAPVSSSKRILKRRETTPVLPVGLEPGSTYYDQLENTFAVKDSLGTAKRKRGSSTSRADAQAQGGVAPACVYDDDQQQHDRSGPLGGAIDQQYSYSYSYSYNKEGGIVVS